MSNVGVVTASANGRVGIEAAIEVLKAGGSALDAVIAGTRLVEANPEDHSVGFSGLPNLLGEVELDASVMEGTGLRAGSVGALQGYQDAVDLARHVMEELPHVLIAGQGSARFAAEMGLTSSNLLTPEVEEIWRKGLEGDNENYASRTGYLDRIRSIVTQTAQDPEKAIAGAEEPPHGTVNFIARDRDGHIACAVSTSGWAWKYPGRLGDSPIIGAGNYADDRWGAAGCTGRGEMAQRCLTAHSVVTFMRFGMSLEDALKTAMTDLDRLVDPYKSEMNIVAMDKEGNPSAASSALGKTFVFMREDMSTFEEAERLHVPIEGVASSL
ncbi:MAG TPA: N(4)-(beta-N-acetylglucosaminyl)-L-asparaginase [Thermomicrobiales bacterium]|nr:N(4)-(beta-N-acetylglucosaminyl)-L-asparaginase [Thermomicrobiales bacterium]